MNIFKDENYFDPKFRYPEEVFKDIEWNDGLNKVSNYGRVISVTRNSDYTLYRVLKPTVSTFGYLKVELRNGGKAFTIHRLVSIMFIPNPNNHPIINHIDNCRTNNYYKNLEWCTYSYNTWHAWQTHSKTNRIGENHPMSLLTNEQILQIIDMINEGYGISEIGRRFNVHRNNIQAMKTGSSYKYLRHLIKGLQ